MNMVRKIGEFMNKKKLFIIMFCVMLVVAGLTGSVAYYRTVVEGKLIASTGNAVFNVTGLTDDGETKVINLGNKLLPGDSGSFDITLDSTGSTVDMYVTLKIDRKVLPDNLKFYSTSDHKSELKTYYSFLEVSGTKSETITIYWYWNPFNDDEDDNKYIGKSLSADISISAVQISEYAMMNNGSFDNTAFWNKTYKPYIRTITFGNDLSNLPSSCTEENLCWDISYDTSQKKKVYGYLIDSGLKDNTDATTPLYNLYIVSEAPIFAPAYCNNIFSFYKYDSNSNKYISNLTQINFNNNFITSKVTNMEMMFFNCSSLTSLDLSNFDTSNVTVLSEFNNGMFGGCSSLVSLDLSSFNTSNVTNMFSMFYYCSSLRSLDLSSFNTSNVTNMSRMFYNCSSLISLDLSNFDTSKADEIRSMFSGCSSLRSLDLSSFNTSNVTNMSDMFYNCSSLTNLDISNFNTSNVTNMSRMFYNCSSLTNLDLSSFNTSNTTNMSYMFFNCKKLETEINIMSTSTTSYSSMFGGALSDANAYVILGYTTDTQSIATAMKNTCGYSSKITLKAI